MFDCVGQSKARYGILLLDGFSMLTLGAVLEPLTLLDTKTGDNESGTLLFSAKGSRCQSSSNRFIVCDAQIDELSGQACGLNGLETLFICGPSDRIIDFDPCLANILRRVHRMGTRIVGLGGIGWSLADIGLLRNVPATVHWSTLQAFSEEKPFVEVEDKLFTSSSKVATCGGEAATLDFILDMIAENCPQTAREIASELLVSVRRDGATPQPKIHIAALRNYPEPLCKAISTIAECVDEPVTITELASQCGISTRKLERLFRNYMRTTPMKYYMQVRLEKVHQLATYTSLSLREISVTAGFSSTAIMNRRFREFYGFTPCAMRLRLDYLNKN
jgi:transcriptional regulator GlxA family with amidase domain